MLLKEYKKLTFHGGNTKGHNQEIPNHPCGFVLPTKSNNNVQHQI
jgi:hypothetical protein